MPSRSFCYATLSRCAASSFLCRANPVRFPNRNILRKGAQVTEVEQVAKVKQLLVKGHKKIRYQKSGIGFSVTQLLK
ncbi:hypothetical protein, partial [Xanthomonas fragariae]|uniref:hypothetical protein n=1 Tax=Xanthomonas fragariae TaxID=48664 RepID=UPI001F2F7B45